ncbi:gliding motility-associated C-terminal domain-containing protein [Crocinitomix catalasitica]|uniref:gliding motility-associated C-terminal domain-containing protein n=1 Tax=Crocinitomix catalasitica TaxID=184607 RepID=UPI000481F6B9|nr:gliding motility-associated C-terminal domain-containing protein [Crocinitomix catalasitica]
MGVDVYDYTFFNFTRWGELLFESHNLNVGWDDYYNGKVAEAGVYLWQIVGEEIISDKTLSYQGQIT